MLNVAIVGYGNLGKALEKLVLQDDELQLTKIYSRRRIDNPLAATHKQAPADKQTQIALVALGSQNFDESMLAPFANFHTVDCYDDHAKIDMHKQRMQQLKPNTLSVVSAGWDPGLKSVVRATLNTVGLPVTIWGKGISMGHGNAVRNVPGVLDAAQFTMPKTGAKNLIKQGETDAKKLHERVCYVACAECDRKQIAAQIAAMPHYFEGYRTEILFCSKQEIKELKKHDYHKGQTLVFADEATAEFTLEMRSNALLTAKIMLAYAKAIPHLFADGFCGAVDVLDIPPKYLSNRSVL